MLALGFLAAYVALSTLIVWRTRSVTILALIWGVIATVVGAGAQLATALGLALTLQTIQIVLLLALGSALALLWRSQRGEEWPGHRVRNLVAVPMIVIALVLVTLRLTHLADGTFWPGLGEIAQRMNLSDATIWLNLASQLTTGDPVHLPDGLIAGPLIIVMAIAVTAAAALSVVSFGGLNEVATATAAVPMASWLLILLIPIALAPLAEGIVRGGRRAQPAGLGIVFGILLLALQSAAVTEAGNLALQYALVTLAFWAGTFLVDAGPPWVRTAASVIALGTVLAWPAFNPLAWAQGSELSPSVPALPYLPDLVWLVLAAVASALAAALAIARSASGARIWSTLAPLGLLGLMSALLAAWAAVTDEAVVGTLSADLSAVTVIVTLAVTAGIALLLVEASSTTGLMMGATAVAAIAFLLTIGGVVSDAVSAMMARPAQVGTGLTWQEATAVRPQAQQPIVQMPVACVFLPSGASFPSALPDPEESYRCSATLVALHGMLGRSDSLLDWLGSERSASGSLWDAWHPNLAATRPALAELPVIIFDQAGAVTGYESLQALTRRFPPSAQQ